MAAELSEGRRQEKGGERLRLLSFALSPSLYPFQHAVLVGDVPKKKRQEIVARLREKEIQVIFATNPLVEEGLDLPHLDRLFLLVRAEITEK